MPSTLSVLAIVGALAATPLVLAQTAVPVAAAPTPLADAAITALNQVCLPLARGGDIRAVARASGLKSEDGQWVLPISGPQKVTVIPPDFSNPHLCRATFTYDVGQGSVLVAAVGRWAATHTPALAQVKSGMSERGPALARTTSIWEATGGPETDAVVLSLEKTLAGSPVDGQLDQATLLVNVTAAPAPQKA